MRQRDHQTLALADPMGDVRRLRQKHRDRLLTLLTILFVLTMFVFAPLQVVGVFIFQGFAIAILLAIIGGMVSRLLRSARRRGPSMTRACADALPAAASAIAAAATAIIVRFILQPLELSPGGQSRMLHWRSRRIFGVFAKFELLTFWRRLARLRRPAPALR